MLNALQIKKFSALMRYPSLACTTLSHNGVFGCRRGAGVGYYDAQRQETLVSWCGEGMSVYLAAFLHKTQSWTKPACICRNHMYGVWDYHNYPVMVKAPNGAPLLFYAKHTKRLYALSPSRTGTLSRRFRRRRISRDACCYPYPVVAGDTIYLFYSKNDDVSFPYRTLRYISSNDNGRSWKKPCSVIDTQKADPFQFDEVYQCGACFVPAGWGLPARIQLAWTMWGGPNGHAREGKGAYYAFLSLEDFHVYGADGADCGAVLGYDDMKAHCLLDAAQPCKEYPHTCGGALTCTLPDGSPVFCYSQRDSRSPDGRVIAAVFRDGCWQKETLEEGTYTLKDCQAQANGRVRLVYCKGRHCVVREYAGSHWRYVSSTELPLERQTDCVPWVNFIGDARPEAQLLLSTIRMEQAHSNYKGDFPIHCLGEPYKRIEKQPDVP